MKFSMNILSWNYWYYWTYWRCVVACLVWLTSVCAVFASASEIDTQNDPGEIYDTDICNSLEEDELAWCLRDLEATYIAQQQQKIAELEARLARIENNENSITTTSQLLVWSMIVDEAIQAEEKLICSQQNIYQTLVEWYYARTEENPCLLLTDTECRLIGTCEKIAENVATYFDETLLRNLRNWESCEDYRAWNLRMDMTMANITKARCYYLSRITAQTDSAVWASIQTQNTSVSVLPITPISAGNAFQTIHPKNRQNDEVGQNMQTVQTIQHVHTQVTAVSAVQIQPTIFQQTKYVETRAVLSVQMKSKIQNVRDMIVALGYTKDQVVPLIQWMMTSMNTQSEKYAVAEYLIRSF